MPEIHNEPHLFFGVDYYPEHWPKDRWRQDAKLMQEAGFNVVRLAEFAWSRLEPQEGTFQFGWLDEAIELLADHNLKIVLGTPTATPPAWLYAKQPEVFRVLPDGRRATFGARRGYSPAHPDYQRHSARIVRAMAEHYCDHPAVIGWQIDNEFGDRDYSPAAEQAFRQWLRERYRTLEHLNNAWGTVFWSHEYQDWSEIPVPLETAFIHNPGLLLDFARFSSDSYCSFQALQTKIIREHCPEHWVTHNLMGFGYDQLNYFELAADLDLVSWDNYPRNWWNIATPFQPAQAAMSHATMRGLKQQPFWVMEQQSGAASWDHITPHPRPGQIRLWAYQALAHGANGIIFFRFRTARFGAEQYWHGLLDHHGQVGRRYLEVKQMGSELTKIGARLAASRLHSKVAMVLDYDARFAFQAQPNHPELRYSEQFSLWFKSLHAQNVNVDIVSPSADLASYKLVIAPLLHVVTMDIAKNLRSFVASGGTLLVTARSGVKDANNQVVDTPLPGLLSELCGVVVEEYDALYGEENELAFEAALGRDQPAPVQIWCDILKPQGATVLARYTKGHYAGKAALTVHHLDAGTAVYMGALGGLELYRPVVNWLLSHIGLKPDFDTPDGVEITERRRGDERYLFIMNHTSTLQKLTLEPGWNNLLGTTGVSESLKLEPYDLAILHRQQP